MIFNFFRNRKKTSKVARGIEMKNSSSNFFSHPDSDVWQYSSDYWYYNKKNITKSSNIITAWVYHMGTDDERKSLIETFRKSDLETSIRYQHFDHRILLIQFDCKNNLMNITEIIDYDGNGNVLNHKKIPENILLQNIEPNSVMEILYKRICFSLINS